jgi:hypothetical protein
LMYSFFYTVSMAGYINKKRRPKPPFGRSKPV